MADIQWFKISNDFFGNRKIKNIKRMRTGDKLIMNWLRTLCIASKINDNGLIYITPTKAYSIEELAGEFECKLSIMEQSLAVFQEYEMISINKGFITVLNWEKYQNVQGLDRIRNQTNERVKRHREKLKSNERVTLHETLSNATDKNRIDKNIKDKDFKDKDKEVKSVTSVTPLQTSSAKAPSLKHKYGEFKHVLLSNSEYEKLIEQYPNYEVLIKVLDEAKEMKGYKYKNDYLAIKKWVVKAVEEKKTSEQEVRLF